MRHLLFILALLSPLAALTAAEDEPELALSNMRVGTQADGFGGESPVVSGDIYNYGSQAYANINILVEAYDAGGELIGEGFGFLVDACGTALLDYALPPEGLQAFSAPFELFEDGEAASVEVRLKADALDYKPEPLARSPEARLIARAEAVQQQAFALVPYVNFGEWFNPVAFRSDLEGILESPIPLFWKIAKR